MDLRNRLRLPEGDTQIANRLRANCPTFDQLARLALSTTFELILSYLKALKIFIWICALRTFTEVSNFEYDHLECLDQL